MSLRVERSDGTLRITFDRPEKRNAITIAMWFEIEQTLTDLAADDAVVVISGAGGTFSAGSDVTEFLDPSRDIAAGIASTHAAIAAIASIGIPSIAVIDGVAAGSALNLALACDLVIASDRASLVQIFAKRGLSPDSGASWLLPRLIGQRRATELLMLADPLDAATALQWGLINRVVPAADLAIEAARLVERIRAVPPTAMRGTRALLAATWDRSLSEALAAEAENQLLVLASPETEGLVTAFTTHRKDERA